MIVQAELFRRGLTSRLVVPMHYKILFFALGVSLVALKLPLQHRLHSYSDGS
ncbi:Hypothetical protein P9303_19171 [Prochlorococcus marinus str. MIT 9303]|uniref:Uncharacterized protein n=1 Tax=Prochlorococcus marinus (strain MIT 9303) TaxID=59922 RepID=A2CAZ9_PROM3|nr:Hypothetical protein P9303_19171 [Prochlorococcus marinus str. MIT 9303]